MKKAILIGLALMMVSVTAFASPLSDLGETISGLFDTKKAEDIAVETTNWSTTSGLNWSDIQTIEVTLEETN